MIKVPQRSKFKLFPNSELIKLKTIANNKAHQKPFTSKPGIIASANNITKALITKRNKPKVMMVKGKVSRIIKGFTVRLIKINRAASKKPVIHPSMEIPGRKKAAINTEMPPNRILTRIEVACDC